MDQGISQPVVRQSVFSEDKRKISNILDKGENGGKDGVGDGEKSFGAVKSHFQNTIPSPFPQSPKNK